MDFIVKLPKTPSGLDAIWVIVDRLTKSAHFLAIKETDPTEKIGKNVHQGSGIETRCSCLDNLGS